MLHLGDNDILKTAEATQHTEGRLHEMFVETIMRPSADIYRVMGAVHATLHSETIDLAEPVSRPHRGRPRHNPTQRDLSGYEHAERNAIQNEVGDLQADKGEEGF